MTRDGVNPKPAVSGRMTQSIGITLRCSLSLDKPLLAPKIRV
jgi:hypothetical protein